MNIKPKISIVVPVFKSELFIHKCIASIQQQSYNNFECFVVNDGSPDKSIDIVNRLVGMDDRFTILNQENKGVSSARNLGIDSAEGEYLIFIDSDDYILSGYFEEIVELMEENSCDAIVFNHFLLKEGRAYREHPRYLINKEKIISQESALSCFLKGVIGLSSCTVVFDRDVFCELRFDSSIGIAEDALLNAKYLLECESVLLSNKSFYVYRQDSGGVTKTGFNRKKYEMAQASFCQIELALLPYLSSEQYGMLYTFIFRHLLSHVLSAGPREVKSNLFLYFFSVLKKITVKDFNNWKHVVIFLYYKYVVGIL